MGLFTKLGSALDQIVEAGVACAKSEAYRKETMESLKTMSNKAIEVTGKTYKGGVEAYRDATK